MNKTKRMLGAAGSAAALLVAVSTVACARSGVSKEEVSRMIDERIGAVRQPATANSGTAVHGSTESADDTNELVNASARFLGRLDDLMKDYRPKAGPDADDRSDALRCVTTYASQADPKLKAHSAKLGSERRAALAAREKTRREFEAKIAPLNHRIDDDWKTRGSKQPAVYGCWATAQAFAPGDLAHLDSWVSSPAFNRNPEGCAAWPSQKTMYTVHTEWKVRVPEGAFVFTYSQSTDPPTAPPELMARMGAAGVVRPERFACRVGDVVPIGERKVISCASGRTGAPAIRVSGPIPSINVGDVVSVPFGQTRRDPDGLLLVAPAPVAFSDGVAPVSSATSRGGRARAGESARARPTVWTVDADAREIKVEEVASCPLLDSFLGTVDGGVEGGP